jgi:hypothetical protein
LAISACLFETSSLSSRKSFTCRKVKNNSEYNIVAPSSRIE